ncbi:MAG: DUF3987 domain-containing protein [Prevotella sp.]|nr:DUF3987 domain-containing protein [Prevotella sp.]
MELSVYKQFQQSAPDKRSNDIPVYGLKNDLQDLISELTKRQQTQHDYVVSTMFAVASECLGKKVTIDSGDWLNHPSIWVVLVGSSSMGKSNPEKWLNKPIEARQNGNFKDYERAMKEYHENKEAGDMPTWKQFFLSDTTYESICSALHDNSNGLLLAPGEAISFIGNIDRYNSGKTGNINKFCDIWDGKTIPYNRRGGSFNIEAPFLSLLGGVQDELLTDILTPNIVKMGLGQRILFSFPEQSGEIPTRKRIPISGALEELWSNLVEAMLKESTIITLNDKAQDLYDEFYKYTYECENLCRGLVGPMYGKLRINVLRWAGIAHFLSNYADSVFINGEEMQYSIDCMHYFERNWLKAYNSVSGRIETMPKNLSKEDMIRYLHQLNPKAKQVSISDICGVSKQYVYKVLNGGD